LAAAGWLLSDETGGFNLRSPEDLLCFQCRSIQCVQISKSSASLSHDTEYAIEM
jgi:hypothetical protein